MTVSSQTIGISSLAHIFSNTCEIAGRLTLFIPQYTTQTTIKKADRQERVVVGTGGNVWRI